MSEKEQKEDRCGVTEEEDGLSPDMVRREFIRRFGVYAAGACVGLQVLMSARTSRARVMASDIGG